MANMRLKGMILEVVDNQLKANDPPITQMTYNRLLGLGYTERQAKEKIGSAVVSEIYDVMKNLEQFDENRYTEALNQLI